MGRALCVWHKACDELHLNDGIDPKDTVNMLTPHCLRHSFASNLLKSGADIKQVQLLMRHDTLESTMHYLHADDSSKASALKLRSERRRQILAERQREKFRVIP
jgi:integrase